MELFRSLLALFTLLSSATAVDCGQPVCQRGGPYCTFSDLWRQFNYTCTIGHLANPDISTVQLYAYNWTCGEIGHSPSAETGKTFDFFSELKYTVVINFNDSAYPPTFMYAGNQYGQNATRTRLPDPVCYNSGGSQACEVQFDCGNEVNMADFEGGRKWRQSAIRTEEFTHDG